MVVSAKERTALQEQRQHLLADQFEDALAFYAITGYDGRTRHEHREISERMAQRALDLALPHAFDVIEKDHLTTLALNFPLRGALALATPQVLNHVRELLAEVGYSHLNLEVWTQGIKRHPDTSTADVYFRSGYPNNDMAGTYIITLDWGTATGLTNVYGAKDLHQHGIPYRHMTSVSMTLAPEGETYMRRELVDPDGSWITIEAATRAALNEVKYIYLIGPSEEVGGELTSVTPKDWGDEMFGMKVGEDSPEAISTQIDEYISALREAAVGFITEDQLIKLRSYYRQKFLG